MRLLAVEPYRGRALYIDSPVGPLGLVENGSALTHLFFGRAGAPEGAEVGETPLLVRAREQLSEYFAGRRTEFDLPLAPFGTEFQRQVWAALLRIPYGAKISYREMAAMAGRPRAFRAVGQANTRNPIAIIIPCHRVVGRSGQLSGFAAGVEIKDQLLRLEAEVLATLARSSEAGKGGA